MVTVAGYQVVKYLRQLEHRETRVVTARNDMWWMLALILAAVLIAVWTD